MTNHNISVNKFLMFGFILLPFLFVTGPLLPDLLVVLSSIYLFYKKDLWTSFKIFKKEIIFFLIFFIYLNLNSIFISEYKLVSLKVSMPYFRYLLFALLIVYFLLKKGNFKDKLYISCLFCLSILFLDSLYQLINGTNLLGYKIYQNRISSFFKDELILGSYTIKLLLIILVLSNISNYSKKNIRYLHAFIFILSYFLILMSNERISFAYLIIISLFYCFNEFSLKKNIVYFFIFILLNILI